MLGEIERHNGTVTVQSRTAYVPQEAWILNASLRDNLVFGSEYDSKRYKKVIDACALKDDLKVLAAGDRTEIGEKGINLSGGQKQRVSLARAVYDQADIYLLDDPLSAVDAHVGKHIFNHVIGHHGMLAGKTRVLVTHGIHWLPLVDNVIVLRDGRVSEQGTYKELLTHDGAFAQFLKDALAHESPESEFIDVKKDKGVQRMKSKLVHRLNSLEAGVPMMDSSDSSEDEIIVDGVKKPKPTIDEIFESIIENQDKEDKEKDTSSEEENDNTADEDGKLIDEEDVEFGNVSWDVYKTYGSKVGWGHFIILMIIFVILLIGRDYKEVWLGYWSEDKLLSNVSLAQTPEYQRATLTYITGFGLLGVTEIITALIHCVYTKVVSLKAADQFHWDLLHNILRAPMSFFDTTPTGRIVTRFSKDVNTVDHLGNNMRGIIGHSHNVVAKIIVICVTTPQVIVILPFIAIAFYIIQRLFMPAALQIRRYCTKSSTPVAVHFTETLTGTESVRAYGAQARFTGVMEKRLETHLKNENFHMWLDAWYSFRIKALASIMVLAISLIVILDKSYSPSMAALFITWSDDFLHRLKFFLHCCISTEKDMVSLERLLEFSAKPQEAAWELAQLQNESEAASAGMSIKPSSDNLNKLDEEREDGAVEWPQSGAVVFDGYKARYRDELDLTLKGVTCAIRCGEKVL
ncbi:multidrug resistance-associated protein 1 [Elysia marginata]|uniref:Multidrug resistance-associated protein 1 n=1 Tax=Elysia marginata TaxID=1093978 RepID=A0AAV4H1H7_9GAST|nr:multidrug resistance-associated protein 1 [Elysia marginata]